MSESNKKTTTKDKKDKKDSEAAVPKPREPLTNIDELQDTAKVMAHLKEAAEKEAARVARIKETKRLAAIKETADKKAAAKKAVAEGVKEALSKTGKAKILTGREAANAKKK